jgi:hypothetical protein
LVANVPLLKKKQIVKDDAVLPAYVLMREGMLMNAKHMHVLHFIYERIWKWMINPLTPGLKPSVQRCLTRFVTGDFAF